MAYIPHALRLKDPSMVRRWERLTEHVRQIPVRPSFVVYTNALNAEWELFGRREPSDPTRVYLLRGAREDLEAIDELEPGSATHAVLTEYQVSTKVPFVIRHIDSAHLKREADGAVELASDHRMSLSARFKMMRMALTTGALTPGEEELDEVLDFLGHASANVHHGGPKFG